MAEFPQKAKVVIIGLGGIVGASIAHHLIERGWDDIVGIDKSGIPTDIGSTAHASDFCYTTSHDYPLGLDDPVFDRFLREDGPLRPHRRP
jgi:glycine/D-amino acid oxidase-like deaminating enzyme